MTPNEKPYVRWYDKDPIVSKCFKLIESLEDSKKHQVATFLMGSIIMQPPYSSMMPSKVSSLMSIEEPKRRWYDYDESIRLFIELIKNVSDDTKREIAIRAIGFIEDLK